MSIFKTWPVLAVLALAACGEIIEVPPAYVGKIKTPTGWQPDLIPPSQFRINATCFIDPCDKVYFASVKNFPVEEEITVFMPKDQLNMTFDVRMTLAVKNDKDSINRIFDKIPANKYKAVGGETVYNTYAQQVVRSIARQVMTQYSINEVAGNRQRVSADITESINAALANKPISAIEIGLADVQFPAIIIKAKEKAADIQVQIAQQEAENQKQLAKVSADLEIAKQRRAIKRENAEAIKEMNEIYAQSVSEGYIKWQMLEVLEKMADNKNAVFVPMGALDEVGLSQRMFMTDPRKNMQAVK